jgi:hypothetical protein
MKRYVMLGLLAGATAALVIYLLRRREAEGSEFQEFFDSSSVADDLFGDAFEELPDKP